MVGVTTHALHPGPVASHRVRMTAFAGGHFREQWLSGLRVVRGMAGKTGAVTPDPSLDEVSSMRKSRRWKVVAHEVDGLDLEPLGQLFVQGVLDLVTGNTPAPFELELHFLGGQLHGALVGRPSASLDRLIFMT